MPPGRLYGFFCFLLLLSNEGVAQQPKLVIPVGHVQEIVHTTFSPDGKTIATSSADNTIKLWHTSTGRLLKTLYGHKATVTTLEFSPKGNYLFSSAIADGTNRIWNLQTGQEIIQCSRMTYPDKQINFSADENRAVSLQPQSIGLWNLASGQLTDSFKIKKDDTTYHYFSSAAISHDGKLIAGYDYSVRTVFIWNRASHTLLKKFVIPTVNYGLLDFNFSANDKQLNLSASAKFIVADIATGKISFTSNPYSTDLAAPQLISRGRYLFTGGYEEGYKIVNSDTMATNSDERYIYQPTLLNLQTFKRTLLKGDKPPGYILNLKMDETGKILLAITYDSIIIYRVENDKLVRQGFINSDSLVSDNAYYHTDISPGGQYILSTNKQNVPVIFDNKGRLLTSLTGNIAFDKKQYFSNDGNHIFTSAGNEQKFSWDIKAGKPSATYDTSAAVAKDAGYNNSSRYFYFDTTTQQLKILPEKNEAAIEDETSKKIPGIISPNGNYVITYADSDSLAKIWDAKTGTLRYQVASHVGEFSRPVLSRDERYMALAVSNTSALLDLMWENLQKELDGDIAGMKTIANFPNEIRVLELSSGKQLLYLRDSSGYMISSVMSFSEASKYFSLSTDKLVVWDTDSWQPILSVKNECVQRSYDSGSDDPDWAISPDGKLIVVSCSNNSTLYQTFTNQQLFVLPGAVKFASFSDDGNRILTESNDRQLKIWDTRTGKLLYTYYAFDKGDFIVTDSYERYDGTEEARKKLYYTCGNEFIDLEQFKDQLWVPNLTERIMNGDTINAAKLSDLNICGLTPEVEDASNKTGEYHFKIKPRRGGLGETVLLVNGIEARRYKPAELKKIAGIYELIIKKTELKNLLIAGKENPVIVKAYTADNTISSRGLKINEDNSKQAATPPNLYAVMVGVSDYKGDELDLKYAAKDATDISAAVSSAAKKLLNNDGKEHVFMYNLTTAKEHYQLPEKISIKKVLEEIGKKATANDILLIFFAGHGVMEGDKKQFYFLTSDASKASAASAVADVGISTAELTEWMKPQNIKAQKRILIFDACNSGQAIKDFVKLGKEDQGYVAVRNDDKAQQIKAIDKLNEKSGLFILSASASNQSAYEMGRYSQGLLTYSLLKAIKQQPDILEEGKYLNVSRWFNAAEKTVSDLSKENGARQEPQIVTNTNFNIGVVDEEVMAKIVLPQEKPLFAASNFQNSDEAIADDDLELSKLINLQLSDIASRGTDSKIVYVTATNSPDAYSLSGRYIVKGNSVTVTVNIKQNKAIKSKFELSGTKDKLNELAAAVADKAAGIVK